MWNKLVVFLVFCLTRIKFDYTLYCKLWFLLIISLKVLVPQSCPILWYPMDCNLQGSSVREILQARMLEWGVIPFSRGSSQLRDRT